MKLQLFSLTIVALLISACTKGEIPTLPQGPQSVQGILRATDISLVRRGSHLLYQDGAEHAYVESSKVNLRAYENQMVTLSGSYELNTDPTLLPVLVVDAVTSFEETTKEWLLPALGISLEAPVDWERKSTAGKVHFHLPGDEIPLVTLYSQVRPTNEEDLPKGVSVVVDGFPAIRVTDDVTGSQTIYVVQTDTLLTIIYNPPTDDQAESLRPDWLHLLASITFDRSVQTSSKSSTNTSAVTGGACGGPAGILCPKGQYCEITDAQNDIGVCKAL